MNDPVKLQRQIEKDIQRDQEELERHRLDTQNSGASRKTARRESHPIKFNIEPP